MAELHRTIGNAEYWQWVALDEYEAAEADKQRRRAEAQRKGRR